MFWATPNTSRWAAEPLDRLRTGLAGKAGGREMVPEAVACATPVSKLANGTAEGLIASMRASVARGNQMGLSLTDTQIQASLFPCIRPHRDARIRVEFGIEAA